jgi:hypothetical protein
MLMTHSTMVFLQRNAMVEYFGEQLDSFCFSGKMAGFSLMDLAV